MSLSKSARPKRRVKSHIHGESGVDLVKASLPDHWVVREISPDYGLDLHIETFSEVPGEDSCWDALGEHFFAQVKTVDGVLIARIKPFSGAKNRIKGSDRDSEYDLTTIDVVSFSLEVEEIETIRRMGSAIPVLLIVVDKDTEVIYYICLNDWISEVLPRFRPDWQGQGSVVVHVPTSNVLSRTGDGWNYISLLAKRPKYYGAFLEFSKFRDEMQFAFNEIEIAVDQHTADVPDVIAELTEYRRLFSIYYSEIANLDVWAAENNPTLGIMTMVLSDLERAKAEIDGIPDEWARPATSAEYFRLIAPLSVVNGVFSSLANIPKTYGTMTRNWNLPTQLGVLLR
ncbi:hypothetical protein ABH922_005781 [Rhodococcus sp. 27YEA15]|uniref:DUF4365 domain-containing protein n=1 Tax=Rhodococcus sp. 27YEA15 TaxID=3156259 RepID=UPI003C7D19B3